MAIVLPTNAQTTLWDFASGTGTTLAFTVPSGVSDGDHLAIMVHGDDNDITWATPSTTSGCTAWAEHFEVNDAGGDDSSIAVYWCQVTTASSASGQTVNLVRSGSEEQVGVMIVVQGAHDDFVDVAWNQTNHFTSDQNTNSPQPDPITTATNDAVVMVMTGARNNWRALGAETGTLTWKVQPPSGYTVASAATATYDDTDTQGNQAVGNPGRMQQGTGNGDAQLVWAYKTVATAGTETPGSFTGAQNTRDHKVATWAIKPAVTAAAPSITSVTPSSFAHGTTGIDIVGTDFTTTQGSVKVSQGSTPATSAPTFTDGNTAGTGHSVSIPAVVSGDTLVMFIATAKSNSVISSWDNFTELEQLTTTDSNDLSMGVAYWTATGTQGATTESITLNQSDRLVALVYKVTGVSAIDAAIFDDGLGTSVNPPSLTFDGDLWLIAAGTTWGEWFTAGDASYTKTMGESYKNASSNDAGIAAGYYTNSASSEDPDAWTIGSSEPGIAITVGITGGTEETQTITSWGDTAIEFTANVDALADGAATLTVINDDAQEDTYSVTVTSQAEATGTVNGGGGLSATFAKTVERTGTVNTGGGIAATVAKTVERTGSVRTGGGLTATAIPLETHTTTGAVSGGGGLTTAVAITRTAIGTINTGGGLTSTYAKASPQTASVNGGGGLTATTAPSFTKAGTVRAGGGLTATATQTSQSEQTSGVMNGGGGLASVVAKAVDRTATMSAGGGLTTTFAKAVSRTGTVSSGGGVTATSAPTFSKAVTLNGGGSLSATSSRYGYTTTTTMQLTPLVDPPAEAPHRFKVRYDMDSAPAGCQLWVQLYSGAQSIDSLQLAGTVTTTTYTSTLSAPSIANIGDYADLWVKIWGRTAGGELVTFNVYDVWLETTKVNAPSVAAAVHAGGGIVTTVTAAHATIGAVSTGGGVTQVTVIALETHTTTGQISGGGGVQTATTASARAPPALAVNSGGSLTASYTHTEAATTTGTVRGGGGISVVVTSDHATTGSMRTGGSIAATVDSSESTTTTGIVNGGGGITATIAPADTRTGLVRGGGSLAATTAATRPVTATIQGGGGISALTAPKRPTTGILSGGGSLTATTAPSLAATGTINGGGSLTATAAKGSATYVELALDPMGDPESDIDHTLSIRADGDGGTGTATISLMQGATTIQTWVGESWTTLATTDLAVGVTEAGNITDYLSLSVRITVTAGTLRVYDLWLNIPSAAPAVVSSGISGGGSLTPAWSGAHTVPAFPSPAEGLAGPIHTNGGGSISATVFKREPGQTSGSIRGGGGIIETQTFNHNATGTVSTGGSITVAIDIDREVTGLVRTGGNIRHGLERHETTGSVSGGGSLSSAQRMYWDLGVGIPGLGETDDGTPPGITDDAVPRGSTGSGTAIGGTVNTTGIGQTDDGPLP